MGTSAILFIKKNGNTIIQKNVKFDGYPEYSGKTIHDFVEYANANNLAEAICNLPVRKVNDDEYTKIMANAGYQLTNFGGQQVFAAKYNSALKEQRDKYMSEYPLIFSSVDFKDLFNLMIKIIHGKTDAKLVCDDGDYLDVEEAEEIFDYVYTLNVVDGKFEEDFDYSEEDNCSEEDSRPEDGEYSEESDT